MQVGAIGGFTTTPYIYNTNTVSRASLNKINPIEDDLLESKTDFSGLSESVNENPLALGESVDYKGIADMQMQLGRMNALRIFG